MSLEEALAKNTAALEAMTAALLKGGGTKGASSTSAGATSYTAKHTVEEMSAALGELKEKTGSSDLPKEIIKTVGGQDKLKDITDPKAIDAVYEACKKKIKELSADDM